MLSSDHVRVRRKGDELQLLKIRPQDRGQLLTIAHRYIDIFINGMNQRRDHLEEQLADVIVPARLTKISLGLKKLLYDRSELNKGDGVDPIKARSMVFSQATIMRRMLREDQRLDRNEVLRQVANTLNIDPMILDRELFGDLKKAQRLQSFEPIDPNRLLLNYELAQEQAILLRAHTLDVLVYCASATAYRNLFRQIKFRRLLCEIHPSTDHIHGYLIKISGPYSLFKSVTKYGLQLSLLLPTIQRCDHWTLKATVGWYKGQAPLNYHSKGQKNENTGVEDAGASDDVIELMDKIKGTKTEWVARRSKKIIHLPGIGICVPDLVFSHPDTRRKVYLEVMGYWSRDAVWKRVELVESGIKESIIFAVSDRLRVSERAIDEELPSALYVYKGTMIAKSLIKKLDELLERHMDQAPNTKQIDQVSNQKNTQAQGKEIDDQSAQSVEKYVPEPIQKTHNLNTTSDIDGGIQGELLPMIELNEE